MAKTVDQLNRLIEEVSQTGYRGRLLAQGQARAMIWRDGELPVGAPAFRRHLSYDLLSFGYSLLGIGLRLKELQGDPDKFHQAFTQAASAIESVVSKGDQSNENRGFYRVSCAVAYHLGRYSARSYSLLNSALDECNLTQSERALSMLILRDFENLLAELVQRKLVGDGEDEALCDILKSAWDQDPEGRNDDVDYVIEVVDHALADTYLEALGLFLLAIETGEYKYVSMSLDKLRTGLEISAELNLVSQWWIHRLTYHLLDELWSSTLHSLLPTTPIEGNDDEWRNLRQLFISLLIKRNRSEIDLWPSQIEAAVRAVDPGDNLVVSLPTSAGKTRIAELCILRCMSQGKRVVYLAPLRALSAQTEVTLQRTFSPLGKTVSTLYGSVGTSGFDHNVINERDIVIATPEKLDFAIRSNPSIIDDVGLVILDEGHMIGMGEREIRYEVQIQRLLRRQDADQRRIVCLSAVLPHGEQFDDFVGWLRRDREGTPVRSDWRPTRLRYGVVIWRDNRARLDLSVGEERPFVPNFLTPVTPNSNMRRSNVVGIRRLPFPNSQRELVIATAWQLVKDGQSVLIYCPERKSVEPYAREIQDLYLRGLIDSVLLEDRSSIAKAIALGKEWLGDDNPSVSCLKLGVAIHHGALPSAFRKEIENLLRKGVLKITVSSPTLAQGLNLTATSIVLHDTGYYDLTVRSRQHIKLPHFKNIVGRAGRAYVDIEGLVLCPMFDRFSQRQAEWNYLVQSKHESELESGLLELVLVLLTRFQKTLGNVPIDEVVEYVMNNAAAWEFRTTEDEEFDTIEAEKETWQNHLMSLDTALLSLLSEFECEREELAEKIDEVLESSFWQRRMIHREEQIQNALRSTLVSRSDFIWSHTSSKQRNGYFLSGVGFESGRSLDAVSEPMNWQLYRADKAIVDGDSDIALEAIAEIAVHLFEIEPFIPKPFPGSWQSILECWLTGGNIHQRFGEDTTEAFRFIEDGLTFRLTWGMEAVRVRAVANNDTITLEEGDFTFDSHWKNSSVLAIESGSLNVSAALLIQAGFSSRLAAIKVVEDTGAQFSDSSELSRWLDSSDVIQMTNDPNWPNEETNELWRDFVGKFKPEIKAFWQKRHTKCDVVWYHNTIIPSPGSCVRTYHNAEGQTLVLSPSLNILGKLRYDLETNPEGLIDARVA